MRKKELDFYAENFRFINYFLNIEKLAVADIFNDTKRKGFDLFICGIKFTFEFTNGFNFEIDFGKISLNRNKFEQNFHFDFLKILNIYSGKSTIATTFIFSVFGLTFNFFKINDN